MRISTHSFCAFVWLLDLFGGCFGSYLPIALENEVFKISQTWVGLFLRYASIFHFRFRLPVDCRRAKEEERRRRRRWRNGGIFNNMKNIDKIYLGFLYFGNSLRSIKRGSGSFFSNKESF